MAHFGFRTRNPSRDLGTDSERLARLTKFLGQLRSEIEGEARGLRARYENAQTSAAFAYQVAEDEGEAWLAQKADRSALAMSRYGERLAALHRQSELLGKLESDAADLSKGPASS
jgi:hypothetical protein